MLNLGSPSTLEVQIAAPLLHGGRHLPRGA